MPRGTRKGEQRPSRSFVLPYTESKGLSAIRLYNSTGRKAQEWQKLLLYDMLAVNEDGLWTHTKFGYSIPRRNGKSEILYMRELYGLKNGEHIIHTAHRTSTTHAGWERLMDLCEKAKLEIKSSYRAFGREHIEVAGGGKIEFRTRTSRGGLGEGFDLLIIDEAQEYADDQETALKYVVTDSKNPQTIFTGTPPTMVSAGTIFPKFRKNVLAGTAENSAWEEWSVDYETDPHDKEAWYRANPSLGTVFTERSVSDEIGEDKTDFNIQRLGLWVTYNQKSAISRREWEDLKAPALPKLRGRMYVGVKYSHDGESVSMAIAVYTEDGKILVECIDCRPIRAGNNWIISFLSEAAPATRKVIIDGANGQQLLAADMKQNKLKSPELPSVKNIVAANAAFEQAIYSGKLCHMGQPSLCQAVENTEKRAIGSNGGFGYRSVRQGVDISLLDAVILAYHAAEVGGMEKTKQRVNY